MPNFNKVILIGHLTRDPEAKQIASGTALTQIGLAVNDPKMKDRDPEVSFFDVDIWGRIAEVAAQYLRKGSPVLIEGRLKQDRWEQNGANRSKVKVVCERMQLMGGQGGQSRPQQQAPQANQYSEPVVPATPQPAQDEEDIPF